MFQGKHRQFVGGANNFVLRCEVPVTCSLRYINTDFQWADGHGIRYNGFYIRAWRLFSMFLVQFFLKINARARKKQTNHQKINTLLHRGNAKCDGQEAFARGTIDDTIDEKQLISNRQPSCSAAKKKKTKDVHFNVISEVTCISNGARRDHERIM